ncbi:MAG: hypothetical protein NTY38_18550 [Acidobacteria bacterium]|nr:hypothetical protein [Acidobacteriota bacterium]
MSRPRSRCAAGRGSITGFGTISRNRTSNGRMGIDSPLSGAELEAPVPNQHHFLRMMGEQFHSGGAVMHKADLGVQGQGGAG